MSAQNYYLLGQAVAVFDPSWQRLTPGCINNLLSIPSRASIVLRHVWEEMLSLPECCGLLTQIQWDAWIPSVVNQGSFWFGYYHVRAVTTKESGA